MSLKDYHDLLIALRKENVSYKDIAERLGYKRDTIKHYCQKNDIRGYEIDNSLETRMQEYIIRFDEKFPNFEYVSGYETRDSTIKVKCKICGHVQERHANNKDYMQCDNCIDIERMKKQEYQDKQKLLFNLIKLISSYAKEKDRLERLYKICQRCGEGYIANSLASVHCNECLGIIKDEYKQRLESLQDRECIECGNRFDANNLRQRCCSDECKRKANNRIKDISRRQKLIENGKIDYSISLSKLYIRDKGICHICGGRCEPKDYIKSYNAFIAGEKYPSIDHVIPVAKGGTHTWDNISLAHRACNAAKGDKIIYEVNNWQLRII